MRYLVKETSGHTVEYAALDLVTMLTHHATGKELPGGGDELAHTLALYLQRCEVMHKTSAFELIHMGAMLGFYYAQLRKNHEVEVIAEHSEPEPGVETSSTQ